MDNINTKIKLAKYRNHRHKWTMEDRVRDFNVSFPCLET